MDSIDQMQDTRIIENNYLVETAASIQLGPRPKNADDGSVLCANCEVVIPERRLKAIPGTGLCVTCADKFQNGELDM